MQYSKKSLMYFEQLLSVFLFSHFWLYIAKFYWYEHHHFSFFKCPGKSLDKLTTAILAFTLKTSLAPRALKYLISCKHVLEWLSFFGKFSSCFYALIIEALIAGKGTATTPYSRWEDCVQKPVYVASAAFCSPFSTGRRRWRFWGAFSLLPEKAKSVTTVDS